MAAVIPFDTLAFVKELEIAGVPVAQAEAQAKVLASTLQKVEEARQVELATKGDIEALKREREALATKEDILRLEKEIEMAKVETIKWVVATGIIILGGVAAINRIFPPAPPVYYTPPAQEMRLPLPVPQPQR